MEVLMSRTKRTGDFRTQAAGVIALVTMLSVTLCFAARQTHGRFAGSAKNVISIQQSSHHARGDSPQGQGRRNQSAQPSEGRLLVFGQYEDYSKFNILRLDVDSEHEAEREYRTERTLVSFSYQGSITIQPAEGEFGSYDGRQFEQATQGAIKGEAAYKLFDRDGIKNPKTPAFSLSTENQNYAGRIAEGRDGGASVGGGELPGDGLTMEIDTHYQLNGSCDKLMVGRSQVVGPTGQPEYPETSYTDKKCVNPKNIDLKFDLRPQLPASFKAEGAGNPVSDALQQRYEMARQEQQDTRTYFDSSAWYGAKTTRTGKGGYVIRFSAVKSCDDHWAHCKQTPEDETPDLKGGFETNLHLRRLTVTAFINPGTPAQGQMEIAPDSPNTYDDWMPVPADDDGTSTQIYGAAPQLSFTATIKPKEPGKPAPRATIDFYLQDVSRNKGTCTNYPKNGEDKDDLRFAAQQAGVKVDPSNPKHAYTIDEVSSASVIVEATDTGAYGKLVARSEELGLLAVYKRTGANFVPIPRDDDDNHVADHWEILQGVYPQKYPANWDEDPKPEGQRRRGDGYTLYEEYRGFVVNSHSGQASGVNRKQFIRTDPRQKDLFVFDQDGLIETYYEPFNPAKLALHYIDASEMKDFGPGKELSPDYRWVNFNSDEEIWYARQYAMYVFSTGLADNDPNAGGATISADQFFRTYFGQNEKGFDATMNPLYCEEEVQISPRTVHKFLTFLQYRFDPTRNDPDYLNPATAAIIDREELTSSIIHEFGHAIGIRHHVPKDGGVSDCAMHYWNYAEAARRKSIHASTRYCTRSDGGDDCFDQIDVKTDPMAHCQDRIEAFRPN